MLRGVWQCLMTWDEKVFSNWCLQNQSKHVSRCWITIALCFTQTVTEMKREGEGEKRRKREVTLWKAGKQGLMFSFHFLCMIQVTGASAENGSPHRAPPEGSAVTGVQMYVCVFACTRAATVYHTSAFHVFVHTPCRAWFIVYACVCVYLCVRIMTVILYDRMITPFSLQPRGVSQLHCSPSPSPKGAMCFHICQSLFPVGSNAPLHLLLSSMPLCLPTYTQELFETLNT